MRGRGDEPESMSSLEGMGRKDGSGTHPVFGDSVKRKQRRSSRCDVLTMKGRKISHRSSHDLYLKF